MFFNGSVMLTTPHHRHFITVQNQNCKITGDRLQLQLYKTSQSIRVSYRFNQEVKRQMFFLNSLICHENKPHRVSGVLFEKMNSFRRFI